MSAIFISHNKADRKVAKELRRKLKQRGYKSLFLAIDPEDGIEGGKLWETELFRAVRRCQAVIALCSEGFLASQWCHSEITLADFLQKELIPLRVGPCDLEQTRLRDVQVIDYAADVQLAYKHLWVTLSKLERLDTRDDWDRARGPYPGTVPFGEQDARLFFGRDDEAAAAKSRLELLRDLRGPRMFVVLGPSGSGKSSLVRAGLLPRLRTDSRWIVVEPFRPPLTSSTSSD